MESGNSLFNAADMIASFENFNSKSFEAYKICDPNGKIRSRVFRLNPQPWSKLENISIDCYYGKSSKLVAGTIFIKVDRSW